MSTSQSSNQLRARALPRRVKIAEPPTAPRRLRRLPQRIREFQKKWRSIERALPPQLSRRHIGMISIGGVIGTGLFLGSADALYNGGPVGAFLGYAIVGTVVYSLCVSIGEMIAFLPNVGGVVGLADLYVDPALGFSLGWASWYNWSITLPAEISAAALVVGFWFPDHTIPGYLLNALTAVFLCVTVGLNLFPSHVYGEVEFWLSTMKVVTIVIIILSSLLIDIGAGAQGYIGFKNWSQPLSDSYLGISGPKGRFMGFWAVLMQASFSFFGSEVPGIAAGEVIDATRNVPRALQRVWIRITLFYLGGIFFSGLLVPQTNSRLRTDTNTGFSSPFVIALQLAEVKILPHFINAAILLSAWSAAASDIYISSRFLFFLACQGHAPKYLSYLIRHPHPQSPVEDEDSSDGSEIEDDFVSALDTIDDEDDFVSAFDVIHDDPNQPDSIEDSLDTGHSSQPYDNAAEPSLPKKPYVVLPFAAVLTTASLGLLAFLSGGSSASVAFHLLTAATSVASLLSWTGMLFTYIRWHQGTAYAEKRNKELLNPAAVKVIEQIDKIKENRHFAQPYLAWYAFGMCAIVLITNGWSVFLHNNWQIAKTSSQGEMLPPSDDRVTTPVATFLASYIPLPLFVLLTVGYKLIYQTKMVSLDQMTFSRENVREVPPEEPPRNVWEKIMRTMI